MAGHSKWANIKHRKAAADSKKSKITTRLVKEITIAAKMGGSDLDSNPRLRLAVEKARENNIPKDNVERAIKRGAGEIDGADYVELRFEGYGFGGSGIIVDCLTDNNTRTVAEVRHAFSKFGGNMGTSGCVAFQFSHCGQLIFAPGADEDKLTELAIDSGALDIVTNDEDGSIEITTSPEDFLSIKNHLEQNGFKAEFAEVVMKAQNEIQLDSEESQKMQRLVDELEALDDVQDVYHNAILDL